MMLSMNRNAVVVLLSISVVLLAADCVWLHVCCDRQREDIRGLAVDQQKTMNAVQGLEKWVATSSVESKIKGYRQELSGYKKAFMDKCRSFKKAVVDSYESMKKEIKDELDDY
jgi:hypothetical protein